MTKAMLLKFFFNQLSMQTQSNYLQKRGILLGTRNKNGRIVYIYMLTNLFVEVLFRNDDAEEQPEKLVVLSGLKNLNDYLEREFKTAF